MARTLQYVLCAICLIAILLKSVSSQTRFEDNFKIANSSMKQTWIVDEGTSNGRILCGLKLAYPDVIEAINGYFAAGTKLLRYSLRIDGETGTSLNQTNANMYHLTEWSLTNSPAGTSLLLLKDYFNEMSLYTLGYGTETVIVRLNQTPTDCLANMAGGNSGVDLDIELLFTTGILESFGNPDPKLSGGIRVCNRHVINTTINKGRFVYRCCDVRLNGKLHCDDVEETIWLKLLFNIIHVLQLLVVLFSPLLIPQTMYRVSSAFMDYVYKPGDTSLTFNICSLNSASNDAGEGYVEAHQHWFTTLNELKSRVLGMVPGTIYTARVREVKLRVKASKIIPSGYVPVGLASFLRKFLFRCGLRKDIPSTDPCCNADMLTLCPCRKTIPWYRCGIYLASAVFPFILMLPWIMRVWFYYSVEERVVYLKRKAMLSRHLILTSAGSLTTDVSPISTIFMVTYILVPVEAVLYTLVPRKVKRKLKYTIKQCFRNMRATTASDICATFTQYLCTPFTNLGIIGCIFLPFVVGLLFPVLLAIFLARTFPLIDVSFRMFINCLYNILKVFYPHTFILKSEDENSCCSILSRYIYNIFGTVIVDDVEKCYKRKNKLIYATSLASCLVTMWLLLLIVSECISFYVECAVYTLIGIILNSRSVMKHITLVLIILYYGYDCFSSVYSIYLSFNKIINKAIQGAVKEDDLKQVAVLSSDLQPNTAFTINRSDSKLYLTVGNYGFLKCSIPTLLLFFNRDDVPFIPRKFLMYIAEKSHFACPKKPHVLYLRALFDFIAIVFFLMFVFIVIFAFGQANNVSSANQALAALGGGFLPLVFRKFLFKSHDGPDLDTKNLAWTTMFDDAIKECRCLWDVEDLIIDSLEEADVNNKLLDDITDVVEDTNSEAEIRLLKPIKLDRVGVDMKVMLPKNESEGSKMTIYVKPTLDDTDINFSRIEKLADTNV